MAWPERPRPIRRDAMPEATAGLDRLRHFIATATRLATPDGLAQSPELQAASPR